MLEIGYGNLTAVLRKKEVFIYKTYLEAQEDAKKEVTVCYIKLCMRESVGTVTLVIFTILFARSNS